MRQRFELRNLVKHESFKGDGFSSNKTLKPVLQYTTNRGKTWRDVYTEHEYYKNGKKLEERSFYYDVPVTCF